MESCATCYSFSLSVRGSRYSPAKFVFSAAVCTSP